MYIFFPARLFGVPVFGVLILVVLFRTSKSNLLGLSGTVVRTCGHPFTFFGKSETPNNSFHFLFLYANVTLNPT